MLPRHCDQRLVQSLIHIERRCDFGLCCERDGAMVGSVLPRVKDAVVDKMCFWRGSGRLADRTRYLAADFPSAVSDHPTLFVHRRRELWKLQWPRLAYVKWRRLALVNTAGLRG